MDLVNSGTKILVAGVLALAVAGPFLGERWRAAQPVVPEGSVPAALASQTEVDLPDVAELDPDRCEGDDHEEDACEEPSPPGARGHRKKER